MNADGLTLFMTLKSFLILKLIKNFQTRKTPSTELTILPGYDKISNYVIGDPVYPLISYCITKFTSCSNNGKVIINNMFRSARNQVNVRAAV